MHRCGLVSWQRRIVRLGGRVEQTSNAYELLPALAPCAPANRCDMESPLGTGLIDESMRLSMQEVSPQAREEAREALARVAAQRQAVILARLLGKRQVGREATARAEEECGSLPRGSR
jgi:hypothetical protein